MERRIEAESGGSKLWRRDWMARERKRESGGSVRKEDDLWKYKDILPKRITKKIVTECIYVSHLVHLLQA